MNSFIQMGRYTCVSVHLSCARYFLLHGTLRGDRTAAANRVTVHSYLVPVTDFADASHSKSAKSATTTVSYGIFSSENACL